MPNTGVMSVAVDFGVTQVADGNWGVHAVIRKAIFPPQAEGEGSGAAPAPSSAPSQPLRNRKL